MLVAVCRDGARLCVRVKLNDKTRGGVSVVQVAADSVVLEATDGSRAPARLNTTERGMQITGADATSRHLLVWNSARAEVHETRGSGFARVSAFDWSGRAGDGQDRFAANRTRRLRPARRWRSTASGSIARAPGARSWR